MNDSDFNKWVRRMMLASAAVFVLMFGAIFFVIYTVTSHASEIARGIGSLGRDVSEGYHK